MVDFESNKSRLWSQDGRAAVFCKARDPLGILGNMAGGAPFVDPATGLRWSSSEAWYQAQRFPHLPELQEEIRLAGNGFLAKRHAHAHVGESRTDWLEVNVEMMWEALLLKSTNRRFVDELLSTDDREIVELSMRDAFWGAKPQGDGTYRGANVLGQLLMQLRAQLGGGKPRAKGMLGML